MSISGVGRWVSGADLYDCDAGPRLAHRRTSTLRLKTWAVNTDEARRGAAEPELWRQLCGPARAAPARMSGRRLNIDLSHSSIANVEAEDLTL